MWPLGQEDKVQILALLTRVALGALTWKPCGDDTMQGAPVTPTRCLLVCGCLLRVRPVKLILSVVQNLHVLQCCSLRGKQQSLACSEYFGTTVKIAMSTVGGHSEAG